MCLTSLLTLKRLTMALQRLTTVLSSYLWTWGIVSQTEVSDMVSTSIILLPTFILVLGPF